METPLSRRHMLAASGLAAAGLMLPGRVADARPARTARARSLRLAHLTDVHVQPEMRAAEGLAQCLRHVQSQKDRPGLILNGGDAVMDSFSTTNQLSRVRWDLWKSVFKNENSIPVESAIGNHDVFGWDKKNSKATGSEPFYGKAMALEMLGLPARYRSFDRGGWHFVVLDSIHANGKDGDQYVGRLDEEQFEWLRSDLEKTPAATPVLVLSHIPILCVCAFFFDKQFKDGKWTVPGAWMHEDARSLADLFLKHLNVKLCLSGHIHLIDRVDYQGVTYLCNGAVCANWWKGRHQECDEGYALVDLYDDGSFDHQYVAYGWKAETPHQDAPKTPAGAEKTAPVPAKK